jgi:hypothetical protein
VHDSQGVIHKLNNQEKGRNKKALEGKRETAITKEPTRRMAYTKDNREAPKDNLIRERQRYVPHEAWGTYVHDSHGVTHKLHNQEKGRTGKGTIVPKRTKHGACINAGRTRVTTMGQKSERHANLWALKAYPKWNRNKESRKGTL